MKRLSGVPILYLNNFPGPYMGGGEVHLLHLVRGAIGAGMDVTVVAQPDSGTARAASEAGARVVEDDLNHRAGLPAAGRATDYAKQHLASIVHGTGYYTDVLARIAGKRAGACVVEAVHCEPSGSLTFRSGPRARLSQFARRLADIASRGRSDAVITDSRALADAVVAGGVKPGKVFVVHNSVDPDRLAEEAAHAARPDLPEASVLVGTLGRLEPVKGLDVLFDAVPLVAGQHPDARFVVAGEGPESENLQMRVATDPVLSKRVEMLGFVPNAPALLDALDVYCLPSRSEGFNTTILEAMALGVPVVATDVGGTREAVEDGVTGRLVPPGDAEALAKALGDLLGDAVLRERLADEARLRVEAQFTVSTMVAKTLAIYERLLAER
jgi:glycosyltransferase involved in cell wall biosynthesis